MYIFLENDLSSSSSSSSSPPSEFPSTSPDLGYGLSCSCSLLDFPDASRPHIIPTPFFWATLWVFSPLVSGSLRFDCILLSFLRITRPSRCILWHLMKFFLPVVPRFTKDLQLHIEFYPPRSRFTVVRQISFSYILTSII